ncbi:neo-calmodulin-like isoform X1 [Artemia franciscana]|uniref:neo-calmodulin-like isoform X1 n=2 Tax=Artemia franciscana TaxID=6661 RepID=UPI0032DBB0C8
MASQFTDVQMEDLRASFALFDQDGDGHITTSELTAVMKCLGQNPTDAEILAIIKEVDADGNGTIEFSEFVIAMAKSVNDIDSEKEIKEAFDVFDKDGNGHINVEELRYVSVNLGETFSDEDIAEMLKQADFDGDGVVNYKDFARMMKLNQRLS